MPYAIPTEHERRALFAWLRQASSLTAWRRLYSYHQGFVDAVTSVYEEEQKTPGTPSTIPTGWCARVLQRHAAFAAALERLRRGDRRCFAFLGAPGHFSEGIASVKWWQDMYGGSYSGRNGWPPADSPRWPEIDRAMHDCLAALTDIGLVLQQRMIDKPAPIARMGVYLAQDTSSVPKYLLSQPSLPPVPAIGSELLVPTGAVVPCYGIWEPVRMSAASGEQSTPGGLSYTLPDSRTVDSRRLDGCINYLHGDFEAPTIRFQEDGQRKEGRPTMWRLVWRDDRYGDQPIPVEESHYVFVQPVPGEVLFRYS
jgi:hypothetical protein